MKPTPDKENMFAKQLVAADIDPSRTESERDQLLQNLVDRENAFENTLGKVALTTWAIAFACVVSFSVASIVLRNVGGSVVEVARVVLMVSGTIGMISLIVGILATLRWLFRSRTTSLAVIERRLAALEELLKKSNP